MSNNRKAEDYFSSDEIKVLNSFDLLSSVLETINGFVSDSYALEQSREIMERMKLPVKLSYFESVKTLSFNDGYARGVHVFVKGIEDYYFFVSTNNHGRVTISAWSLDKDTFVDAPREAPPRPNSFSIATMNEKKFLSHIQWFTDHALPVAREIAKAKEDCRTQGINLVRYCFGEDAVQKFLKEGKYDVYGIHARLSIKLGDDRFDIDRFYIQSNVPMEKVKQLLDVIL